MDRLNGVLSLRSIRRHLPKGRTARVCDIGCGYRGLLGRAVLPLAEELTLVDLVITPDLAADPRIRTVQGELPGCLDPLPEDYFDVVLCYSILEHLDSPQAVLDRIYRILKPGGVCLINVPSWRGKPLLEWLAFTVGWSPKEEMDDHRMYYDTRDLWPMCVKAGFIPSRIVCHSHKFGFATFALCRR
jgi:2-polyprenyl-3-methyl-5-hydroxy-6-metoxy-1,4-benzoquinol methylase